LKYSLQFQHTSERDLRKLFGEYGEIESVQIVYDRFSGRSRGFGFVYFTSTKDATRVCFLIILEKNRFFVIGKRSFNGHSY